MNDMTYEKAIIRLEEIVEKLEGGDLPLDESIKLFEESTKLSSFCVKSLNNAELRIKELSEVERKDEDA